MVALDDVLFSLMGFIFADSRLTGTISILLAYSRGDLILNCKIK